MIKNGVTLARDLRKWLLRHPKPTKVLVHRAGREVQELRMDGQSWARIGETIATLQPELVEAYDESDKLVRALRARHAPPENAPKPKPKPKAPAPKALPAPKHCRLCNQPIPLTHDLMLLTEVASEARVGVDTVRHWIQTGKLPSVKPGRKRMVLRSDFEAFMRY